MSTGALIVWSRTFSTKTVPTVAATGMRSRLSHRVSQSVIMERARPTLSPPVGSSLRARRRMANGWPRNASSASSRVGCTGTYRVTPPEAIARRTGGCAHTSRIGTSGHTLTCQRALVNTVHADADGAERRLTSTITARGSSSAALFTVSRTVRYVELSSTPSITRIGTSCWGATSIRILDRGSAIGTTAFRGAGRQPLAEHAQLALAFLGQRVVVPGDWTGTGPVGHFSGQPGLFLQAAQGDPERAIDLLVASCEQVIGRPS